MEKEIRVIACIVLLVIIYFGLGEKAAKQDHYKDCKNIVMHMSHTLAEYKHSIRKLCELE